jgi:hypothetical protein
MLRTCNQSLSTNGVKSHAGAYFGFAGQLGHDATNLPSNLCCVDPLPGTMLGSQALAVRTRQMWHNFVMRGPLPGILLGIQVISARTRQICHQICDAWAHCQGLWWVSRPPRPCRDKVGNNFVMRGLLPGTSVGFQAISAMTRQICHQICDARQYFGGPPAFRGAASPGPPASRGGWGAPAEAIGARAHVGLSNIYSGEIT